MEECVLHCQARNTAASVPQVIRASTVPHVTKTFPLLQYKVNLNKWKYFNIFIDVGGCYSSPCVNGATCQPLSNMGYSCSAITQNLCSFSPCLNGGTCTSISSTQYSCMCANGYQGTNCTTCKIFLCYFCHIKIYIKLKII